MLQRCDDLLGQSGTEIAAAWREMNPLDLVSFNLPELRKGLYAQPIATLDGVRTKVFTDWGLDFPRIRAWQGCPVTFNYFNFSTKQVGVLLNGDLDSDYLCACVSLITWFPPVQKNGAMLVDAVFATDADVWEAERRHADEIWAIWSVANVPRIRNGFIAQYFHILEQAANANFLDAWNRKCGVSAICSSFVESVVVPRSASLTPNRSTSTAR